MERLEDRTLLSPFIVNSTADSPDVDLGDGKAEDELGRTTLRAAIQEANASEGPNIIRFDLGFDQFPIEDQPEQNVDVSTSNTDGRLETFVIQPGSPLPALTDDGTVIDGRMPTAFDGDIDPDGLRVVLDGSRIRSDQDQLQSADRADGLRIDSNGNTVVGLNIRGFSGSGIVIRGNDNHLAGNYIGTDETGTAPFGNGLRGVMILDGAQRNAVGTDGDGEHDAAEGNVISANTSEGVFLSDSGTDENVVAGNFIGTDVSGQDPLGNLRGVIIRRGAEGNLVGTDGDGRSDALERNVISANALQGVRIFDAGTDENVIAGNYIGTDATGTAPLGNEVRGVVIAYGAQRNLIGTDSDGRSDALEANVISANARQGVRIVEDGADENRVAGNFIGTDATGTAPLGNGEQGVFIDRGAQGNVIGTDGDGRGDEAEGNVISANGLVGVYITDPATQQNVVAGNLIGTDVTGTADLGNSGNGGVRITGGTRQNLVGTNGDGVSDRFERNVISGNVRGVRIDRPGSDQNVLAGNFIGTDITGTVPLPNDEQGVLIFDGARNNLIGTDGDGRNDLLEANVISANGLQGVRIVGAGTDENTVAGNYIGTDVTGTAPLGNAVRGVVIAFGAQRNLIGTDSDGRSDALEANVISANARQGVRIVAGADENRVAGNFIGTDITGTAALSNGRQGVFIDRGARQNVIGTDGDGRGDEVEGNVISANGLVGVFLTDPGTEQNVVAGNLIGTDVTGTQDLGNGGNGGVRITGGARRNLVGTNGDGVSDELERNVLSGNFRGVRIDRPGSDENVIAGNFIGTAVTGTRPLPNDAAGVLIFRGARDNLVGTDGDGTADAAERNVISANTSDGIRFDGFRTTGNRVLGNFIGTDATGTVDLGNGGNGVRIQDNARRITVGTTQPAGGNTIAFNAAAGVAVTGGEARGNSIRGNSIHSNGGLGIDLGDDGRTANDPGDADAGPNTLLNAPVVALAGTGSARVIGTYEGAPETTFTIDVYANAEDDPTGYGEGERYLGSFEVTTDAEGAAAFDETLEADVATGELVTATATDAAGNTSEFSIAIPVNDAAVTEFFVRANEAVREVLTGNGIDPDDKPTLDAAVVEQINDALQNEVEAFLPRLRQIRGGDPGNVLVLWFDPVDFVLTDPQSRSAGFVAGDGGNRNEIGDDALYSGDGVLEMLVLAGAEAAPHNLELVGLGTTFTGSGFLVTPQGVRNARFRDADTGRSLGNRFDPSVAGGGPLTGRFELVLDFARAPEGAEVSRLRLLPNVSSRSTPDAQSDGLLALATDGPGGSLFAGETDRLGIRFGLDAENISRRFFDPLELLDTLLDELGPDARLPAESLGEVLDFDAFGMPGDRSPLHDALWGLFWSQVGQSLLSPASGLLELEDLFDAPRDSNDSNSGAETRPNRTETGRSEVSRTNRRHELKEGGVRLGRRRTAASRTASRTAPRGQAADRTPRAATVPDGQFTRQSTENRTDAGHTRNDADRQKRR